MADALIEEDRVTKSVPDSCRIVIGGKIYSVTYAGANGTDLGMTEFNIHHMFQYGGGVWDAHGGIFHVRSDDYDQKLLLLRSLLTSNQLQNPHQEERRGGDSNPRCGCIPTRRFSKPLP